MSKAFKKETHDDSDPEPPEISSNIINYVTPYGLSLLQKELHELLFKERPKIVEVVSWAAGNGDRSENGDYIYGKKRLREIDRRIRYLTKRVESAKVIDPKLQQKLTQVYFGATVTYSEKNGVEKTVTLVGIDEADLSQHKINWSCPLAKALLKSSVGDVVEFSTPAGKESIKVIAIRYISTS